MRVTRQGPARALTREIQIVSTPGDEGTPLYSRIYRQLREHILSGALARGALLPSARTLAADLGVSRNTVEAAFAQLVSEGFVERRVGAGTVVSESVSELAPFAKVRAKRGATAAEATTRQPPQLSARGSVILKLGQREVESDLDPLCATNIHRFPLKAWSRVVARAARRADASLLAPVSHLGLLELRQQIAEYATLARGLRCAPDQVLIVSSAQQALDLAARVLMDPGDTALIEEPSYPSARAAFLVAGAKLKPIPVDSEGLDAGALPTGATARLLYITPSHQFPLGVTMSLARRLAVLRWAAANEAWVIEDDYDSEFRYDGRPIAALQALDRAGRVLYVGTYNKVLFPGLRLGYMVLPPGLIDAFAAARRLADGYSAPFMQTVLADFIASGRFAAYLRQARLYYTRCRDQLVARVDEDWGNAVQLGPASTGLHVVAHLPKGTDDASLAVAAQNRGLGIAALSRYYFGSQKQPGLMISYGATSLRRIATSVGELSPLFTSLRSARRRR
ncbi:MAG: PLP-dependent aminotransferase family protein [Acidobacteriota bacterium]